MAIGITALGTNYISDSGSSNIDVVVSRPSLSVGDWIFACIATDYLPGGYFRLYDGTNYTDLSSVASLFSENTGNVITVIRYGKITAIPSGSNDITIQLSGVGPTARAISAYKVTGLSDTPIDKSSTGTGTNAPYNTGATGALSQADELAVAVIGIEEQTDNLGSWTTGAGYVSGNEQTAGGTTGGAKTISIATAAMVTTTTDSLQGNMNALAPDWAALIATFKAASDSNERTGTAIAVLDGLTAVTTGTVAVSGNSAVALGAIGQTITGAVDITGSGAVMLDGIGASASGTVQEQGAITGILDATLSDLTTTASGTVRISGGATSALDGISTTMSGGVEIAVVSSVTLDGMVASGSGVVTVSGESSNVFSSMSMDATGLTEVTGSASKALDGLTGEIIGVVGTAPVTGLLEGLFSGMTCQMVGVVPVSGTGAAVLDGIGAWVTAWTEDLYSLQPGSRRRIKVPRPKPARAGVSTAMRHERQDSFKVEGD